MFALTACWLLPQNVQSNTDCSSFFVYLQILSRKLVEAFRVCVGVEHELMQLGQELILE